ncbi:CoA ester lyase [Aquibium sp. ELW1220]|uniref:HpcH/HpaI aldolase/citrate lyase family protein n=1 Tax=Aquibium sp. ELW1220 TaxID=2976766 RepID=UPI0025B26EE8|nr:CoA ester lyase [Aquibium sp. ELW1220]MDN2583371.1 CoA ester lyase [Aquibium sp. ELW1220]
MRSLLFVPASRPEMFRKARASGAGVVVFDLEDAVRPSMKEEARETLARHRAPHGEGPATAIRVNGLKTGWCEGDIELVRALRPDFVMLPKAEGPHDVARIAERLDSGSSAPGILAVATETSASVLSLAASDWRHPRLKGLLWGAEDLAADLGATGNRSPDGSYSGPFRLARDLCLMAARKAGVLAIDAVHTAFRDLDDLRREAEQARRDGFDAKAAIHPAQVEVINAVFRPDAQELRWAEAVLASLAASGDGVAVVDGAMVDAPHASRARRILGVL